MATSYGALCTDFYVNQKLALKMDLPHERESTLHLFERVRQQLPQMKRFRRFSQELSLESPRDDGQYLWMALRRQSIRSGHVNPEHMEQAYALHHMILQLTPYFLTLSPLDMDHLELLFGFDLECKANHNRIVHDALLEGSAMASLVDPQNMQMIDVQPMLGVNLTDDDCEAFFEVKSRTTSSQVRRGRYRAEAISVFLIMRQSQPAERIEDLPLTLQRLRTTGERLLEETVVPKLVNPISRAIISST